MTDEDLTQKTNASVRHGKIIVITSLASIIVWLLISEGYTPRLGFFINFFYLRVEFFEMCEDRGFGGPSCGPLFSFMTKNLILLSFMIGTYGVLVWQMLAPSPVFFIRTLVSKAKDQKQPGVPSKTAHIVNIVAEKQTTLDGSKEQDKTDNSIFLFILSIGLISIFIIIWLFLGTL